MNPAIHWLHISDLHYSEADDTSRSDQVQTLAVLFDDIKKRIDVLDQPIDVIFFSGDMVHHGDEYDLLNEQIEELYKCLSEAQGVNNLPPLLPVPGNHDVSRPKLDAFRTQGEREIWDEVRGYFSADKLIDKSFWQKNIPDDSKYFKARELVNRCFENYQNWAIENIRIPNEIFENQRLISGDFAYSHEIHGFRLGVLGLNSSFLQLSEEDFKGNLELSFQQAHNVVPAKNVKEWVESNHFNILMTHHPLSWLKAESLENVERNLLSLNKFPIHLSGHLHEPASLMTVRNFGANSMSITAPSLYGLEYFNKYTTDPAKPQKEVKRLHGFTVGQISRVGEKGAKIKLSPRVLRVVRDDVRVVPDFSYDLDESNGRMLTKSSVETSLFHDWPKYFFTELGYAASNSNLKKKKHRLRVEAEKRIQSSSKKMYQLGTQDFVSLMSRAIVRTDSLVQFSPFSNNTGIDGNQSDNSNLVIVAISTNTEPTKFAEPKLSRDGNGHYRLARLKSAQFARELIDEIESSFSALNEANINPDLLALNELAFPLLSEEAPEKQELFAEAQKIFAEFASTCGCTVIAGSYHNDHFYNVAPIYGPDGNFVSDHSRVSNPFDYTNVVRTPSNQKLLTYSFSHGEFAILLCRDSYDPKMLFKLITQHNRNTKGKDLSVIFVLALTTNKDIETKLTSAARDLSLISNCAVVYINSSASVECKSSGLFIGGQQYKADKKSSINSFVTIEKLNNDRVSAYRINWERWRKFQDEQFQNYAGRISRIVEDTGQSIDENASVFTTGTLTD